MQIEEKALEIWDEIKFENEMKTHPLYQNTETKTRKRGIITKGVDIHLTNGIGFSLYVASEEVVHKSGEKYYNIWTGFRMLQSGEMSDAGSHEILSLLYYKEVIELLKLSKQLYAAVLNEVAKLLPIGYTIKSSNNMERDLGWLLEAEKEEIFEKIGEKIEYLDYTLEKDQF